MAVADHHKRRNGDSGETEHVVFTEIAPIGSARSWRDVAQADAGSTSEADDPWKDQAVRLRRLLAVDVR
jgi:hypothetical protein